MRFPASFVLSAAAAALLVCAGARVSAQAGSSSSSSGVQTQSPTSQPNPAYVSIDPLANVRYDQKWDLSVEVAYQHLKAGPNLLQGANLGGLNVNGSYYLAKRWRLEGTVRPFFGTSGAAPNTFINSAGQQESIQGPFIAEYLFAAGPEFLGPHNKHGDIMLHVLAGGAYGNFEHDLRGQSPELVGFYNNQVAPLFIAGGHIDLNRSAHWVFRMSPDATITHYGINYGQKYRQWDFNAAFSVGVEYKFAKNRK
jgi:hypothetical protein